MTAVSKHPTTGDATTDQSLTTCPSGSNDDDNNRHPLPDSRTLSPRPAGHVYAVHRSLRRDRSATTNGLSKAECACGPGTTEWNEVDEFELATLA
jgi:hypothetical protein